MVVVVGRAGAGAGEANTTSAAASCSQPWGLYCVYVCQGQ